MRCATCGQSIASGSSYRWLQTPDGTFEFHPQCYPEHRHGVSCSAEDSTCPDTQRFG